MIRNGEYGDLEAILAIYNDAVLNTTASYDYRAHTLEDRIAWYEDKGKKGLPVLVYEDQGQVAGFATYGPFRPWPGYKYTIENSVYVDKNYRGKRIGTLLLQALIDVANANGYATMVAVIDASNTASRILHEKVGFKYVGTLQKAGYKFGRWLDVCFYQYHLRGPDKPTED